MYSCLGVDVLVLVGMVLLAHLGSCEMFSACCKSSNINCFCCGHIYSIVSLYFAKGI